MLIKRSNEELFEIKIGELNKFTIAYLEEKILKLTPAGRFQAWILTATMLIHILKKYDAINNQNIHTVITQIKKSCYLQYLICEADYHNTYIIYEGEKVEKTGSLFLDELLRVGNETFKIKNEVFYEETVEVGISHFYVEFEKMNESYKVFSESKKGLVQPTNIFINLFVFPFFNYYITEEKKEEEIAKIFYNIENESFFKYKFIDFRLMPFEIYNKIHDLIRKDLSFVEMFLQNQKEESTNSDFKKMYSKKNNTKSCYIATMAYEDINHPKVQNFRDFRDDYLAKTVLGNLFIKYYYKYSPSWVKVLEPHKTINKLIRLGLDILNYFIPKSKL